MAHVKEVSYHDKGANIECDASFPSISLRQYHDLSLPLHVRWRAISVRTDAIEELASLFSRIYQLFRLETINLRFNPVDGNESDSYVARPPILVLLLLTLFCVNPPP